MKQTMLDDVFKDSKVMLDDWLELKLFDGDWINVRKSQIEYVREYSKTEVEICLKSGTKIIVNGKYKEIMEMV